MASVIRVTGAWTQLLADWLDHENLPAPDIRAALARWAPDDIVPIPVWRALLERATALRPLLPAPGLAIGAQVHQRHVGVLGYVVLAAEISVKPCSPISATSGSSTALTWRKWAPTAPTRRFAGDVITWRWGWRSANLRTPSASPRSSPSCAGRSRMHRPRP